MVNAACRYAPLTVPSISNARERPAFLQRNRSAGHVTVLLLAALALGLAVPLLAAESPRAAQVRTLNNRVLALHAQMQAGADIASARAEAAKVIQARAAALQALIGEEPATALTLAFSPELLADLAAKAPGSAARLESHTTVSGPVEHWIADYPDKTSRSWWRMNTGGRSLTLYFTGQSPAGLGSDEVLEATGVLAGSDMAVGASRIIQTKTASGVTANSGFAGVKKLPRLPQWPAPALLICGLVLPGLGRKIRLSRERIRSFFKQFAIYRLVFALIVVTSVPGYAQSSCSTTGVQQVAVLLVTFPGVTPPSNITPQNVSDMFFSATGPSLDGYWREASYGQTSATGSVSGWYTLDSSYANCSRLDLLRDAAVAAAANAGVPIQDNNRIFIVATDFGCGWTGVAMGQCTTLSSPNGSFLASTAVLDASWQRSQVEGAENAAHEGGHNMGLGHAQSRTFGTEPLGPLGAAGTLTEYGDHFSDMSASNIGHYAAPHKAEMLGWMPAANYQSVQTSGSYTMAPLELGLAGPQALKVQRGTGNTGYYLWIEYREPIGGYDSTLWPPPQAGALIHYEDSSTGSHTQLLDFTPQTSYVTDAALMPGSTWADPYTDLSLSVLSATSSGLTVNVSYSGSVPCTHVNPSVGLTPVDPSTYAGTGASYTMTVTNNDSTGCSASLFTPSSTQPAGWTASFSAGSVSLSPGQSSSVTMTQTPPLGTPPATYPVTASAVNLSYVGTASGNLTVVSAPSLSVSVAVPSSSYKRKSTAPITATVLSGGAPASGASVTFTLVMANGKTVTQSASTASTGTATWSYKLAANAPTGPYSVSARTTLGSQSATGNAVSFTVQ